MRPFTGTKCQEHLENWSFCRDVFNFLQVSTLDDFTWNLQSCFTECYFILSLSNLSQLLITAFQSSLLPAPEYHLHHHAPLLTQWPSWLSLFTPEVLLTTGILTVCALYITELVFQSLIM